MRVVTFHLEGHGGTVVEALTDIGFVFDPSQNVSITLLDTFDGRLHRAGLRLQVNESVGRELLLTGESGAPARLVLDTVPRMPADLPSGPLRSRIAALTDVRALVPQLQVRTTRTRGVWRDPVGKIVAVAEMYQDVDVVGRPDIGGTVATIEISEVPGYPKHARRSIETIRGVGLAECDTDTLTQCAAAAGIELAGFTETATVPLDREMAAIDGFRTVLANLAATISANWQGTIDRTDPEFLHDLRIAVRRTRTILAEAKYVLPTEILEPTRGEFKWLAGLTGTPRDLDVHLLGWTQYTDALGDDIGPSLEPVRALLERRRADSYDELRRSLGSERAMELMAGWRRWLTEPLTDDLPRNADRPLGEVVATRIARGHRVLLERGRKIDRDTPAVHIHDLRKDAKKLRYLLECFGSLLPDKTRRRYVKRLKALQDNLGEFQDADVQIVMLGAVARDLHDVGASPDTMLAIGRLIGQLDRRRDDSHAEFVGRFADYDTRATRRAFDGVLEGIEE